MFSPLAAAANGQISKYSPFGNAITVDVNVFTDLEFGIGYCFVSYNIVLLSLCFLYSVVMKRDCDESLF